MKHKLSIFFPLLVVLKLSQQRSNALLMCLILNIMYTIANGQCKKHHYERDFEIYLCNDGKFYIDLGMNVENGTWTGNNDTICLSSEVSKKLKDITTSYSNPIKKVGGTFEVFNRNPCELSWVIFYNEHKGKIQTIPPITLKPIIKPIGVKYFSVHCENDLKSDLIPIDTVKFYKYNTMKIIVSDRVAPRGYIFMTNEKHIIRNDSVIKIQY
jgi:hypothetical protein